MRCETCRFAKWNSMTGVFACMSKTGPARGWYTQASDGCAEWREKPNS